MSENKKDLNNVWIAFRYNCIKETKKSKAVILNESTFTETLEKTLDKWYILLEKNKILYDDIKKIKIDFNEEYNFMKPKIEIKLTDEYEIFYQYGINLKIEDFIKGAIEYLKDSPIKLKHWDHYFTERLSEKLNSLKIQLKSG